MNYTIPVSEYHSKFKNHLSKINNNQLIIITDTIMDNIKLSILLTKNLDIKNLDIKNETTIPYLEMVKKKMDLYLSKLDDLTDNKLNDIPLFVRIHQLTIKISCALISILSNYYTWIVQKMWINYSNKLSLVSNNIAIEMNDLSKNILEIYTINTQINKQGIDFSIFISQLKILSNIIFPTDNILIEKLMHLLNIQIKIVIKTFQKMFIKSFLPQDNAKKFLNHLAEKTMNPLINAVQNLIITINTFRIIHNINKYM